MLSVLFPAYDVSGCVWCVIALFVVLKCQCVINVMVVAYLDVIMIVYTVLCLLAWYCDMCLKYGLSDLSVLYGCIVLMCCDVCV